MLYFFFNSQGDFGVVVECDTITKWRTKNYKYVKYDFVSPIFQIWF